MKMLFLNSAWMHNEKTAVMLVKPSSIPATMKKMSEDFHRSGNSDDGMSNPVTNVAQLSVWKFPKA